MEKDKQNNTTDYLELINLATKHYANKEYQKYVQILVPLVKNNYSAAQDLLGTCYFWGTGVSKDRLMAAELFKKSADQGHKKVKENLDELINSYY